MNLPLVTGRRGQRGFTLIDLVIALAILGILLRIAFPSYQAYLVRGSRLSAQGELVALANLQEKIFLNGNAYTTSVTTAYTGQPMSGTPAGGLGVDMTANCGVANASKDCRYSYSIVATGTTFTLTASPKAGTPQVGDGNLTINEQGVRTWSSNPKGW